MLSVVQLNVSRNGMSAFTVNSTYILLLRHLFGLLILSFPLVLRVSLNLLWENGTFAARGVCEFLSFSLTRIYRNWKKHCTFLFLCLTIYMPSCCLFV